MDTLVAFETAASSGTASAPVRYAVRQVLDQEYQKNIILREHAARQARYKAGNPEDEVEATLMGKANKNDISFETATTVKKDFFGRVIRDAPMPLGEIDRNVQAVAKMGKEKGKDDGKVWVTFHEGFSNAVRKPITIDELLRGL